MSDYQILDLILKIAMLVIVILSYRNEPKK